MCNHNNLSSTLAIRRDIYNDIYELDEPNSNEEKYSYVYLNLYDEYDEYDEYDGYNNYEIYDDYIKSDKCNKCLKEDTEFNLLIEEIYNVYSNEDEKIMEENNKKSMEKNNKMPKFNILNKIKKYLKYKKQPGNKIKNEF
jgi:hypothetical protein